MTAERVLLLFDRHHPCWDEAQVVLAGEDPGALAVLRGRGLLQRIGGGYALSEAGRDAFVAEAASCFLDARPGAVPRDPARALARNRLALMLDRSFLGRWGAKEFRPGATLPVWPDLRGDDLGRWEGRVSWTFPDHPLVRALGKAFPLPPIPGDMPRSFPFSQWLETLEEASRGMGVLELDLLFLQRFDFAAFLSHPPLSDDTLGLVDSDRLLFRLVPEGGMDRAAVLEDLGRLARALDLQRRIALPGRFDRDREDQDAATWWVWVTAREADAKALAAALVPWGEVLGAPARPLELWTLSVEFLESLLERQEAFWDLFALGAHPVLRMRAPG